MAFIGAGYIFRTAFFLNAAREGNWVRLRWIVWGNLAFTGTLLLATYWHVDEFHWNPFKTPLAHLWIVLYIFEPVVMLYLVPRGTFALAAPPTGGPLLPRSEGASSCSLTGAAADARPAAGHQPGVRRRALAVGAQSARRPDGRGLVPRLGGVAAARWRSRRDWDEIRRAVQLLPAQRGRVARDGRRLPRRASSPAENLVIGYGGDAGADDGHHARPVRGPGATQAGPPYA